MHPIPTSSHKQENSVRPLSFEPLWPSAVLGSTTLLFWMRGVAVGLAARTTNLQLGRQLQTSRIFQDLPGLHALVLQWTAQKAAAAWTRFLVTIGPSQQLGNFRGTGFDTKLATCPDQLHSMASSSRFPSPVHLNMSPHPLSCDGCHSLPTT